MTIQEMIDQFGTEKRVEANHCVLEGAGENLIYQAEVTGIPVQKILDYIGQTDPEAIVTMSGVDGFANMVSASALSEALLVYEMTGEPVHLEGYSHAYVEPITTIEFSLDGGETWKTIDTPNMDPSRWIYWKMDLNLEPGAYTLQMRATSIDEETGEPHSNFYQPKFLINVQ